MFYKLKTLFKNYGTELLVVLSIIFLLIYAVFRMSNKESGTYTPFNQYKYLAQIPNSRPTGINLPRRREPIVSKSEGKIRQILEHYFNKPFDKARPDFLRNPVTGNNFNLELDCYNPQLKLAVEYNGIQHYKYTPFFHRNKEAFLNQKYRDDMKRRICREYGVTLIEVPYTVKYENLEKYMINNLKSLGY
jgi:hypothetical protein